MNVIDFFNRLPRRQFNKFLALGAGRIALIGTPLGLMLGKAWAQVAKRLLPADTQLKTLIYEDPKLLDTSRLPLTPVDKFGIMGLTDHATDLVRWHLTVDGGVARPQAISYEQLKALPSIQRDVLLICPGVFAYNARWQGVSIRVLLKEAGVGDRVDQVAVKGPGGSYQKIEKFPLSEIETDQVFLAYGVNGQDLPQKHGFPLRAVAEGHLGFQWVKFVDTITAVASGTPAPPPPAKSSGPAFVP
jgi:DMSO/TMAO reductase YedYZ molybdopterin-dependent catalytic subunit